MGKNAIRVHLGLVVKNIRGTECKRDRKNMAILLSVATSKRGGKRKKINEQKQ